MSYQIVEKVVRDPFSFVRVQEEVKLPGTKKKVVIEAIGFAKRASIDTPNPAHGIDIALTRALGDLQRKRQLLKAAYRRKKNKSNR